MIWNADDDMIKCNTQTNDMATTAKNWRTPGASNSGRHNPPPLQEDLVPRSRMAPERNGRGRSKTKLLLGQTSETTNLERLNRLKEEYNIDERAWKHSVSKEEQGTL